MERKKQKMLLVILMIITILATDFFVLSSGIKTYASQLNNETNNPNIEFSAYFKEGENRVDSIEKSIKAEDVRLYTEIKVKNEGYLKEGSIIIGLENSNFNLKSEILPSNTHIKSIEGNTVNLKQINSGETVEIELGIEPIITDKISTDFLSKTTTVKMIGSYVYSKSEEGQSIRTDKWVSINYIPDETTEAELEANIITNKVFSVNGEDKRIIQASIKSRITNNEYPVEQTKLEVSIPILSETEPEISALAIGQLATNGQKEIKNIITENGNVQITLNNEIDENNQVSWTKNAFDEIIVTYIYPETVDASKIEITANSEIKLYAIQNTYTATHMTAIENQELNNVIMGRTEITTEELYKGNLYAKIEEQYNTKTSIIITNSGVSDQIVVYEGLDTFSTAESEISANTKYISTEINLENILNILGQDGSIEIKNGEESTIINKDTEVNESGNVVINYENGDRLLTIITSKPEKAGILELKHKKGIIGDNYTREQLQEIKTINARNTTLATLDGEKIVENTMEPSSLELKETITKAELTIENNKKILSTTEENEVTLGITLVTNGKQYDLYKNPKMSIKFPEAVTNVELISEPNKQNADEFTVDVGAFNTTNKTMQISLQGEQTTYSKSELTQGYIQLNLKVTLNSLALAQTDKIIMAYINENAIEYDGGRTDVGIVEQAIEISAPSQLIKMYNVSSNENTSLTETILEQIDKKEAGKTKDFEISLINNKDSDISNLKILGKLPTTENTISGQETNTLETKLKGIRAENATIYYTENTNPTSTDIEDVENGWTENLTEDAKMYLIQIDTLARGTNYTATITEQLPSTIEENGISYSQYGVIYDTKTETEIKEVSRKIGLAASTVASIKTEITAQVGQDVLESGDVVKEGEVIKYTVTVKNTGANTLENVQLKLDVPEGTTFVRPLKRIILGEGTEFEEIIEEGAYGYVDGYYEEVTDANQLEEATTITIPSLTITQPYEIQYEVRVNKGSANTEIINKPVIMYNDTELEVTEFICTIQEANARVTIKSYQNMQLLPGGSAQCIVYVENITNSTLNNLELEILSKNFNVQFINTGNNEEYTNKIQISELGVEGTNNEIELSTDFLKSGALSFTIYGIVDENANDVEISAILKDAEGNKVRSNCLNEKDLPYLNAIVNTTSPQNGKYIKEGDTVEYNVTIKNTSEIDSTIQIKDVISQFLNAESIFQDGQMIMEKTDKYNLSNDIDYSISLKQNEQTDIKIISKVAYIPKSYHNKVITNNIVANINGVLDVNSQTISHILQASEAQEANSGNIINGFVWFDENENGKRDYEEAGLSGITAKIFNVITQKYVTDENNNTIETTTDENGQYTFTNIENGNYLVIFEYDTEKYVLTTGFAQNVDTTLNSKAVIKKITTETHINRVAGIEINNLAGNAFDMNMGLMENTGKTPIEEQPGTEELPNEEPTNPEDSDNPSDSNDSNNPNTPSDPIQPETPVSTQLLNGYVWLDENLNGKKESTEPYLSGIKVRLYDINTKEFVANENGQILEVTTNENGKYEFGNIKKGSYMVVFEYDTEKYKLATQNIDTVLRTININGKQKTVAITNVINVQGKVYNINLILQENLKFDLELNKYISKIVVQTQNGTKTYDYNGKTLGKVEIHRKQIQGALVILEYTIKVKNNGELVGTASNVVDYLPTGLTFSSELNTDWYLSGKYLYSKALENMPINPGEEKELKLVLTKTMTSQNVGLINNRAEIYEDYNKYGEPDIDSTPNNHAQNEDDFGTADVIIQVATGGSITLYIILMFINVILIFVAIRIMIKNEIIHVKTKEVRR